MGAAGVCGKGFPPAGSLARLPRKGDVKVKCPGQLLVEIVTDRMNFQKFNLCIVKRELTSRSPHVDSHL